MTRKRIIALVFSLGIATSPYMAFGTTGSVTIDFGGLCSPITIAQSPPFYLFAAGGSFTCASGGTNYFKIEDNGANRAQVLPSSSGGSSDSDGSDDTLRVKDWKITALTATPADPPGGYQISVSLQFGSPPDTDGPGGTLPDIYYKTTSYGSITKTTGNWMKMDPGYVTNPLGSAETTLGTSKTYSATCLGAGPCNFSLTTSGKWPDGNNYNYLSGARILRTKFSFNLNAVNDVLLVNSTGGKINSQDRADPDDQDQCSLQYTKCPSFGSIISSWIEWTKMTFTAEPQKSAKLDTFTKVNWASLEQNMASGSGEYLASLAALLEIPLQDQPAFFLIAQDQYRIQAEGGIIKRSEFLPQLQEVWAKRAMLYARAVEPSR